MTRVYHQHWDRQGILAAVQCAALDGCMLANTHLTAIYFEVDDINDSLVYDSMLLKICVKFLSIICFFSTKDCTFKGWCVMCHACNTRITSLNHDKG